MLILAMHEIFLYLKKAAFASDKNIAEVEAKKDELAAISADILTQAKARAKDLEGSECEILVPVTEEGLFMVLLVLEKSLKHL